MGTAADSGSPPAPLRAGTGLHAGGQGFGHPLSCVDRAKLAGTPLKGPLHPFCPLEAASAEEQKCMKRALRTRSGRRQGSMHS